MSISTQLTQCNYITKNSYSFDFFFLSRVKNGVGLRKISILLVPCMALGKLYFLLSFFFSL